VRLVKDINAQMNIIGDGINVAQRVMSFSQSGQLLVSRSFYEVVSCLSLDYASLFSYVGARTDKHVREHEVYSVGIGTDAARRVLETGSQRVAPRGAAPRLFGELTDVRPFGMHRMALLGAPLAFALLVGGGVAVRAQMKPPPESVPRPGAAAKSAVKPVPRVEKPAAIAKVEPAQAPKAEVVAAAKPEPAPKAEQPAEAPKADATPAPKKKPVAKALRTTQTAAAKPAPKPETAAPAASPAPVVAAGVIQFAILPWGEVFVDGRSRGVSPPLRMIELPPGPHAVEVRNTSFPTHTQRVEVRSGEPVRIRHQFR